jgi:hypothetical protein
MNFSTLIYEFKKIAAQNIPIINPDAVNNIIKNKKFGPLGMGLAFGGGMVADNVLSQMYRDHQMGKNIRLQQQAQY